MTFREIVERVEPMLDRITLNELRDGRAEKRIAKELGITPQLARAAIMYARKAD